MVKACRKNTSKRITCRKRYKIIRKVREHHRKLRKELKKNPKKFKRKDPGVPNSLPFKEELLKHVDDTKKLEAEYRIRRLSEIKENSPEIIPAKSRFSSSDIHKQFFNVINESSILLEVLDARDPLGTRSIEVENQISSAGKKLILVLNKIDLVPQEAVKEWLIYFRKWYTIIPFKANTQKQTNKLALNKGVRLHSFPTNHGLGVDGLLSILTKIRQGSNDKTLVGVVGMPNTGKSSIINTLKRHRAAKCSSKPGITKERQIFHLDSHISLLDSPGIVLSKNEDKNELALRGCSKIESIPDPMSVVSLILQRCPVRQMLIHYSIKDFNSTNDFLAKLALRMGRLKKRGIPDIHSAAKIVIDDWNVGKLAHYTLPPKSGASIVLPSLPSTISLDIRDMPLYEFDKQTLSALGNRIDPGFCPPAIYPSIVSEVKTEVDSLYQLNEPNIMDIV